MIHQSAYQYGDNNFQKTSESVWNSIIVKPSVFENIRQGFNGDIKRTDCDSQHLTGIHLLGM